MAFNKFHGSKQVQTQTITDSQIAAGASIAEAKLNIDWVAHGHTILASKAVVDYVQVNAKTVNAGSDTLVVTTSISATPATTDAERGAIVQLGKNLIIVRSSVSGEPIVGEAGHEVYGKLSHNNSEYIVSFFTKDADGVEVAYTFPGTVKIDFQFPQRFDLDSVPETFAMNEKFVDGLADISERMDLAQIGKDVFGGSYALNHTGAMTRAKALYQEFIEDTRGVTNTTVRASAIIDEVIEARNGQASLHVRLNSIENTAATNTNSIANVASEVTTARGEYGNLNERLDDLTNLASGSGAEVVTARSSTVTGDHASLDARLESAETRFEAVKTEVEGARGAFSNVDARLDDIDTKIADEVSARTQAFTTIAQAMNDELTAVNSDISALSGRTTALESKKHSHLSHDHQILAGDPMIGTSQCTFPGGLTYTAGNKSLDVYVNGAIQMVNVHYTEVVDGGGIGIGVSFTPELLEEGYVLQFRWYK